MTLSMLIISLGNTEYFVIQQPCTHKGVSLLDRWQFFYFYDSVEIKKMGNVLFGDYLENGYNLLLHPEIQPDPNKEPTFDPNLGFPNGRKERGEFM